MRTTLTIGFCLFFVAIGLADRTFGDDATQEAAKIPSPAESSIVSADAKLELLSRPPLCLEVVPFLLFLFSTWW